MTMATFDPLAPTHLRLMAQLGHRVGEQMMGKSQTHADALHAHLTGSGPQSTHSIVPSNPQKAIAGSTKSDFLTPAQQARADRESEAAAEAAYRKRKRTAERRAAGYSEEDEDEGESGSSLSKSLHCGAFQALRKSIAAHARTVAKAIATQDFTNEGFERDGSNFSHAHAIEPVRAQPTAVAKAAIKPTGSTFPKSFARVSSMMKSMGLEVSYNSDSGTLMGCDAIRKQSLAGAKPAKPKAKPMSADDLVKGAAMLLYHGRITPRVAQRVQSEVLLMGTVSADLMKALQEACK